MNKTFNQVLQEMINDYESYDFPLKVHPPKEIEQPDLIGSESRA